MSSIVRHPRRIALALALLVVSGGALGGMAAAGTSAKQALGSSDGPAACEIRVARKAGSIGLTAFASSAEQVSGSYSLRVSGRGTNIQQSGPFRATPGKPATLGTVTLGANGGSYKADLDLTIDGDTLSCSQRIDGGI